VQATTKLKILERFCFPVASNNHHVLSDVISIYYGTEAEKRLTSYRTDKSESQRTPLGRQAPTPVAGALLFHPNPP